MWIELGEYVIRDWTMDDASAIARHANNRSVAMWLRDRFPSPYTLYDAQGFLATVCQQDPRTNFAIAMQREAMGGVGLDINSDVHRFNAELGYWLGEPFWGRGIMSQALSRFTAWGFRNFALHRIYAHVFANNAASMRVLEKAGFECEGCLRASVFKNGRILDQFVYAKLREGIR